MRFERRNDRLIHRLNQRGSVWWQKLDLNVRMEDNLFHLSIAGVEVDSWLQPRDPLKPFHLLMKSLKLYKISKKLRHNWLENINL